MIFRLYHLHPDLLPTHMSQAVNITSEPQPLSAAVLLWPCAGECFFSHHTVNDLTASRQSGSQQYFQISIGLGRERESGALTRVFLDELIDVDPAARAPSVKHDPVENPAGVDGGGGFNHRMENLSSVVGLRCRMHDFGHRVESLW